jgi:hypothetical protein
VKKPRHQVDQELKPSVFTRKVTIVLCVLTAAIWFCVMFMWLPTSLAQHSAVAVCALVVLLLLLITREKHTNRLIRGYTDHYFGSVWSTPAGEDVTISGVDFDGMRATVRFEDGDKGDFSLWTLTPKSDHEKVPAPDTALKSDKLLMTVSNAKWKHVNGRIGVVRGARREHSDETVFVDYITLKTDFGTHEYERNYLTPVN